jgi:hypothetical protein
MNQYRKQRLIDIARSLQDLRTGNSLHFSFILRRNKLLITSVNSYEKLHPYHKFGKYLPVKASNPGSYIAGQHSETAALKAFINRFGHSDFTGLTLFNVRLSRNCEPMLSKPCRNCETLLNTFNFKSIEYTT